MAITSSSTRAEVLAQYNDNLLWEGDITKAQNALEAIRWLLINRPQQATHNGRTLNYAELSDETRRIAAFVSLQGSSVNRAPFTAGRARM